MMIRRYASQHELAQAAADLFVERLAQTEGRFSVVLSGGSTPKPVHRLMAANKDIDWDRIHVFWGDERTVPPQHPDSNYRMACETLLDEIEIPQENIHRIPTEYEPEQAAAAYDEILRDYFGNTQPRFDLVFLGMGDDGHTASLFPQTQALHEPVRWVVANHIPKLDRWRITLTAPVINMANTVVFLVSGASKADTLREVVNGPYQPDIYPAQFIDPESGQLIWMVDKAAAELL